MLISSCVYTTKWNQHQTMSELGIANYNVQHKTGQLEIIRKKLVSWLQLNKQWTMGSIYVLSKQELFVGAHPLFQQNTRGWKVEIEVVYCGNFDHLQRLKSFRTAVSEVKFQVQPIKNDTR